MTARGCVLLAAVLVKCVLSVPLSTGHMENEDVQVMKCIVEVLADVLSKPHTVPVSQQCLQTLRADDRLVTILRHRNFLQELQDIAMEGANQRPEKRMKDAVDHVSNHPEGTEKTAADWSMLVAMERPGEEKEEKKKRGEEEDSEQESKEEEQKMHERNEISSQEKRNGEEEEEDIMKEEQEHKRGVMKKKGDNEDEEEKRSKSEEEEEEEEEADEAAGAGDHSDVKKSVEEEEESQEEQDTVEKRREGPGELEEKKEKAKAGVKHWSHTRQLAQRRAEKGAYVQQEAEHHSKEVLGQGEGEVRKSPEEQELQMMARRDSEDRREEEGSASKKTEDAEIESLAAIESELENVAQKLHELRHG
ncbi:chromogranin-A isoform X2 [Astyanax mexicanus]|uniref:Chromogranin-A n=1 Tax=Astyanax mexicanus TaxID=7994 RepID=A0A8B9HKS9_ASTMX|nr:chromogranin-A isoform X2 [Astyanax mexicanus]